MEIAIEFAKLILPAAAVLYAMYLTTQSFLKKEMAEKLTDLRTKNVSIVTPVRLQAYERLCLLLERIMPNSLLVRLNDGSYSGKELQHVLITAVREEFNHNLSQQVYVSDEVWERIKNAVEDVILTINKASEGLKENAGGTDLAKKIFEIQVQKENDPIQQALFVTKQEVRHNF